MSPRIEQRRCACGGILVAERAAVDHELSMLYVRLLDAQEAAEMAGLDDMAAELRSCRTRVHVRLAELAGFARIGP